MTRLAPVLALLAGLGLAATPARAQPDAHRHSGGLFQFRFEPEMNRAFIYRAFLADPDDPASLIVERGGGSLGEAGLTDVTSATCPAAARAVRELARLPLPTLSLGEGRPYNIREPRGDTYYFSGFAHFPNGGEGEVDFYATDVPGRPADPLLVWMRGLMRAFDACRPRAG